MLIASRVPDCTASASACQGLQETEMTYAIFDMLCSAQACMHSLGSIAACDFNYSTSCAPGIVWRVTLHIGIQQ